jgi:hypothetical protein
LGLPSFHPTLPFKFYRASTSILVLAPTILRALRAALLFARGGLELPRLEGSTILVPAPPSYYCRATSFHPTEGEGGLSNSLPGEVPLSVLPPGTKLVGKNLP